MLCSKSLPLKTKSCFKVHFFLAIVDVILNLGMIGATLCLLYGVYNKKDKFLLPLIWFLPFEWVVRCFLLFFIITFFVITDSPSKHLSVEALVILLVAVYLAILYDLIFWLCVHSHRKQLISNNDNTQDSSGYASKD